MKKGEKKIFQVVAAYDTETTNYCEKVLNEKIRIEEDVWHAFPILFIVNDLRDCNIADYHLGDGTVSFYRNSSRMVEKIREFVNWGIVNNTVPIVCAYNLVFDLYSILKPLSEIYDMHANAQSSTNVYTLDLYDDEDIVLRFWDTFHLELNGLSAMGQTCGLPKLVGDWDYSKVRTQDTEITEQEYEYAKRDVEVIPAYLSWLINSNEWLSPEMLGVTVITKSSLVRQMSKKDIGNLRIPSKKGKRGTTLQQAMKLTVKENMPQTFEQYAYRKASFRGGLTFTAANNASKLFHRVCSLDVTSMHHAFIAGRFIPVKFRVETPELLKKRCERVLNTELAVVLANYAAPFSDGLHVCVKFENLRLKKNSVFERDGIATLAAGKFAVKDKLDLGTQSDRAGHDQDVEVKALGYRDFIEKGAVFAFSKLMSAKSCIVWLSEIELWIAGQVYDFDSYEVIEGEGTSNFVRPPDFVILQTHVLFERKNAMKKINNTYIEGVPYTEDIPDCIPAGIAELVKSGKADANFIEAYYIKSVKAFFNAIYGCQCMDVFRPDFKVEHGVISVDHETLCNSQTFDGKYLDNYEHVPNVLYHYGLRIVAGSRQHLVLSMILIHKALGDKVIFLGGDTDSIKIAVKDGTDEKDVLDALEPLHEAITEAIDTVSARARENFPEYTSDLKNVGCFEVEPASKEKIFYDSHIELWNKCRVSMYEENGEPHVHVTAAGLSRPSGCYNIENLIADLTKKYGFEKAVSLCINYDIEVCYEICFSLQHTSPTVGTRFEKEVTDYLGNTSKVSEYECTALYAAGRLLGGTDSLQNWCNVEYLRKNENFDKPLPKSIIYNMETKNFEIVDMNGQKWQA